MKKITFSLLLIAGLIGSAAHAADRNQARAITQQLNNYVTPSASVTPNKALLYRSNAGNVDDTQVVPGNAIAITATSVKITRGESIAITRCTADYGTANIITEASVKKIEIVTTHLPVRVLCSTADGQLRAFYTTYQE